MQKNVGLSETDIPCQNHFLNRFMISVIIPTLQKKLNCLSLLVSQLDKDINVGEIIIIDNARKGILLKSLKLKVISPECNLYVNPSWNLGVEIAKYEIIALLNDDIVIPENFCSNVINFINPNLGILGVDHNNVFSIDRIEKVPNTSKISLHEAYSREFLFGIAMFFYRSSYCKIPNELKILCRDDYIFNYNIKKGRRNYLISGQDIYHFGSLSSSCSEFNSICKKDKKIFSKLTVKWYERIFSIHRYSNGYKLRFFFITKIIRKKII